MLAVVLDLQVAESPELLFQNLPLFPKEKNIAVANEKKAEKKWKVPSTAESTQTAVPPSKMLVIKESQRFECPLDIQVLCILMI